MPQSKVCDGEIQYMYVPKNILTMVVKKQVLNNYYCAKVTVWLMFGTEHIILPGLAAKYIILKV